jgi:hypothetical protein
MLILMRNIFKVVEKWWDDNSKLVPTTWQNREI